MSIILHVIFAVISLIITAVTAVMPTARRLSVTYVSIFLTLGSGVLLAVLNHALILRVCTTGLTYLAIEVLAVGISLYRIRKSASVVEGK